MSKGKGKITDNRTSLKKKIKKGFKTNIFDGIETILHGKTEDEKQPKKTKKKHYITNKLDGKLLIMGMSQLVHIDLSFNQLETFPFEYI